MEGARVRNFIPLLVEHDAAERPREEAQPQLPVAKAREDRHESAKPSTPDPQDLPAPSGSDS